MSGFIPGPSGGVGPVMAYADIDSAGLITSGVGLASVTHNIPGQYDIVFTIGFFANIAYGFAMAYFGDFTAVAGDPPNTVGCRIYVYDGTSHNLTDHAFRFWAIATP